MKFIKQVENKKGHKMGLYICPYCESKTVKRMSSIKNGTTKSCGCSSYKLMGVNRITHDLSRTKLYSVWHEMIRRCVNQKHFAYKRYGGRGISVCNEWEDVSIFYNWAINNGYEDGYQLDRVDNDGNYCPENCRFVTQKENMRNNSQTKLNIDTVNEIKKLLSNGVKQKEIAKIYNVDASSISNINRGVTWA